MSATTDTCIIVQGRLLQESWRRLLANSPFEVVAVGATIEDIAAGFDNGVHPQLILFDPGQAESGLGHKVEHLMQVAPDGARVVVVTADSSADALRQIFSSGAHGYLCHDLSPQALLESLRLVMLGEQVYPAHLLENLIGQMATSSITIARTDDGKTLSPREIEILRCLVSGFSNKLIANHLGITDATVKVHLKTILRKISAANRTQAAIWAYTRGLPAVEESRPI